LWSRRALVGPIVPRAPGLSWVLGLEAGDGMVDGSIRRERLRPLVLRWIAALGRESRKPRELAGSVIAIGEWLGLAEAVGVDTRVGDGFECLGPELAQRVEAAPGELAGDRHRRARVREPPALERQVPGSASGLRS